jgi:hypothetical protein
MSAKITCVNYRINDGRKLAMEWVTGGALTAGLGLIGLAYLFPRHVRYSEEVEISASAAQLYDHIRLQLRLMRWSAWPSETGSACTCEGVDGEVGARTVFFTKAGKRFGHQEVTALEPGKRVTLRLTGQGPPQDPVLTFHLEDLAEDRTRVRLEFDNTITRPFNVVLRLAGVTRWTRAMHRRIWRDSNIMPNRRTGPIAAIPHPKPPENA